MPKTAVLSHGYPSSLWSKAAFLYKNPFYSNQCWRRIQTQSSVLYSMTDRNRGSISLKHILKKAPSHHLRHDFRIFFLYKKETFYTLQHCLPFQFQLKWDENILLRALTAFQWHHLELLSLLWHWDLKSFQPAHVFDRQYWISKVKYTFSCLYAV